MKRSVSHIAAAVLSLRQVLLALFSLIVFVGQAQTTMEQHNGGKVFDWGLRVGVNAISITSFSVELDGEPIPNGSYVNRTGFMTSGFMRINLDKFFIQPEVAWNMFNHEMRFGLPNEDGTQTDYHLRVQPHTISSIPLFGYNIVKNGPFKFGIIAGPALKYNYRSRYKINGDHIYIDKKSSYTINCIVGFSAIIKNSYVDIRYEFTTPDANLSLGDAKDMMNELKGIKIIKNENILSFSCGMMF